MIRRHKRPAGLGDNHFGTELVELVPQLLGLEAALNSGQQRTIVGRRHDRGAVQGRSGGGQLSGCDG